MSQLKVNNISSTTGTSIGLSASITPAAHATYDLGTEPVRWRTVFGNKGDFKTISLGVQGGETRTHVTGGMAVSGTISPRPSNAYDLGSSTYQWKNLYVKGNASINELTSSRSVLQTNALTPGITASVDIVPGDAGIFSLGASARQWQDLYVKGNASINELTSSRSTLASNALTPGITASVDIVPGDAGIFSLGASARQWQNLFVESSSLGTSGSYAAVRFQNLPTSEALAKNIGSGSLWLSGSLGDSKYLMVYTG